MAAAAEEMPMVRGLTEATFRQWVEANPARVNDIDKWGYTLLYKAALHLKSMPLIEWFLGEKGADVNGRSNNRLTALHQAGSLGILIALMDHGANPTLQDDSGCTALMNHAMHCRSDLVARMLQYPRVRATIDLQSVHGSTALHLACNRQDESSSAPIVHLLLQAHADPALGDRTPLKVLRMQRPSHNVKIAFLEQVPEAEKTSIIVKARRLAGPAVSNAVAPSCLQARVMHGNPLPHLTLLPATDGHNGDEEEESFDFRKVMEFLLGMGGGPKGMGMLREVFQEVLDFLMPSWETRSGSQLPGPGRSHRAKEESGWKEGKAEGHAEAGKGGEEKFRWTQRKLKEKRWLRRRAEGQLVDLL